MQNSNMISSKSLALSSLVDNSNGNKSEVNAVSAAESPNSFQHMFSKKLQQEQANKLANQQQVNQTQANKTLENQKANTKAQQANAESANANQVQKSNATASQAKVEPPKKQNADESAKTQDASAKETAEDAVNMQAAKIALAKKITTADLVADLKLAQSKGKADATVDEASEDEASVKDKTKTNAQDILTQEALQAAALAAAQLVAQKPMPEMTNAAFKSAVDSIEGDGAQKLAQSSQIGADLNLTGKPNSTSTDQDASLDQESLNKQSEQSELTKQAWVDGVTGKSSQANADKQAANFAENLAEKAMQSNLQNATLQNAIMKNAEQVSAPVSMSQVSAYQSTANNLNASTAANGASNYIAASPGKSGWDQALSQKVVWMVGAGEQSATLNLNPPDLGPLQVVINVNNDKADTTFISQNVEVRKALEEGMSSLRDMMQQAGVELGQANVSTNSQAQQNFQQASKQAGKSLANQGTSNAVPENLMGSAAVIRSTNGLVDTFA